MQTQDTRLAARLVQLRITQDLTLAQLADQSGISRATLSRIERAENSPTAAQLGKLAQVFGLTMSQLLHEIDEAPPELLPRALQPIWLDAETGFERRSVSPPAAGFRAELIEGRLRAGAEIAYAGAPVAGMQQHIWLLEGTLEYRLGERTYQLAAGDCLRFRLQGPSHFRATGPADARYLIVICQH
ncbi:helix-turn-helix domain-containing protein [Nissabacter sp. SGAir0207]|uniref:helix-turn-helix domain-containing protein n=1 Tax=Nissabacter sp. SGAir0207 TaxID=2126321 RepID=UPI0010CD14DF|nr:XRE family transcriptional regulator [Nissabacter sp. SGAir0207]QCR36664.1 transcriptional regulator [Nissabacter sp. SGAir0207]